MTSPAAVDVDCSCGHRFCFGCCEEAHQPVTCQTVRKWIEKNRNEAENMTWILANTKPCPKCKHPIEKNQGCMHMVCRCGHQFCWLCLADDHNYSHTRDGRPCNKYLEEPDGDKEAVRANLVRYAHYFERFKSHERAQQVAKEKTLPGLAASMEQLSQSIGNWMDVTFLEDATKQVVECRRVLKWSYAYGFLACLTGTKKDYFEFQQGCLEQKVDLLQELSEKTDLKAFQGEDKSQFNDFKSQLVNITKVVRQFFASFGEIDFNEEELAETTKAVPKVASKPEAKPEA